MLHKTTDELNHEIQAATNIEDYLKKNSSSMKLCSLSEHLNSLLSLKSLRKSDVIRGSLLDRTYVYQIFSGEKNPSRDKLLALSFGLKLNYEETQKMLKLSGNRELYARDKRDALIIFSIRKQMSIIDANTLLFEHNLNILGNTFE